MADVGGSHGSVSIELLRKFPALKYVVEDLRETINNATTPPALEGRLELRAHNFFTEQPVENADVYFLRSILHDWSGKYAIRILINLIPALKKGAMIIFNEVCLLELDILSCYQEQLLRGYDLVMKTNLNSRERDANDWVELLKVSSPRFKLREIKCSPGSTLSVIEVMWEDERATSKEETSNVYQTSADT